MSMTGRERAEYLRWKKEREQIDEERLARHRNATGQWRREWDAQKTDNMWDWRKFLFNLFLVNTQSLGLWQWLETEPLNSEVVSAAIHISYWFKNSFSVSYRFVSVLIVNCCNIQLFMYRSQVAMNNFHYHLLWWVFSVSWKKWKRREAANEDIWEGLIWLDSDRLYINNVLCMLFRASEPTKKLTKWEQVTSQIH